MKKYFKVLATVVLVATMFGLDKTDNSTLEDTTVTKVDFSNKCVNMIRDKEDPIHIRREGDEELLLTKKTSSIILKDTTVDKNDITFRDNTFYDENSIIGQHYEYSIVGSRIDRWEGIYSHFTRMCTKDVLKSRAVSIEGDYIYSEKNFISNSIYYSEKIDIQLESSLNSVQTYPSDLLLGTVGITNNFKLSSQCSRDRATNYYKEMSASIENKIHYELNSNAVDYCPDAYNIGLGLIGTFYRFEVQYKKYANIFGDKLVEEGKIACCIAKESDMAVGFVYTKGANSKDFYYKYK